MRSATPQAEDCPAVAAEPVPARPAIHYIPNPITVAGLTPRIRNEIALRDSARKALSKVETLVAGFVGEKRAERLSDADIDELFVIELPIQLRVSE
ncbi:hypothetical protein [Rhizobium sp. F40D2]|uniref:hypothetical protein n=1 Tax=Rhizobium sp. F40D2 TaxID=3453141 RepID=UPI003F24C493